MSDYALPSSPSAPSSKLSEYSLLLYGEKKIGKTSLCSHFPDPLFLSFEPGTRGLSVKSVYVRDYEDALGYLKTLKKSARAGTLGKRCKTVIVDTVDLLYDHIWTQVCAEAGVKHPTDAKDYGATWKAIREKFHSYVYDLLDLGCGVVMISHETEKEVELRNGDTAERIQPTMPKQSLEEIIGVIDIIARYYYERDSRFIRIRGSQLVVAGCRCESNFLSRKGSQIVTVAMGSSSKESMTNLVAAFNNQQLDPDPATTLDKKLAEEKAARRAALKAKSS